MSHYRNYFDIKNRTESFYMSNKSRKNGTLNWLLQFLFDWILNINSLYRISQKQNILINLQHMLYIDYVETFDLNVKQNLSAFINQIQRM